MTYIKTCNNKKVAQEVVLRMARKLKIYTLQSSDFQSAWAKLLQQCLKNESPIRFGDENEPKALRGEICSKVALEGKAVEQILNGVQELGNDSRFHFGPGYIQKYVDEYTMDYIDWQRSLPDGHNQKFVYTYYERFRYYPAGTETFDQVEALKQNLQKQIEYEIFSNRHQMTTWIPSIDAFSESPPCLQRIWISLIDKPLIEIHLDWRSRDLFGAWHVNLIALINMINRDIATPLNCKIARIVDSCDSLHIYNGNWQEAQEAVKTFRL